MSTPPEDGESGFDALDLPEPLREAIRARGLTAPTLVQSSVAASEHAGRDLLVSSRTGSGKTLAFGLLIAREILPAELRPRGKTCEPLALVLAPTRELAVQVQKELEWLFAKAKVRVLSATGGTSGRDEMFKLKGGCEILVATPGRLVDHISRKTVALSAAKVVVLDEGDEMLRFGFREDLEKILEGSPETRRTHLFSATLPPAILKIAATYQKDPARITAAPTGEQGGHADIEFIAHVFAPGDREAAVVNVLRRHDVASAIVFTETRAGAAKLGADLARRGFAAVTLSGEMTQPERTRALASLREGRSKVLVATDVAARGLDLPDVGLVVHADLPNDASGITHRSGRTGRAGKKGVSVLLAARNERNSAERMLRGAGVKVRWSPLPTAKEIAAADEERLAAELASEAAELGEGNDLAEVDRLIAKVPVRELVAVLLKRVASSLPEPASLKAVSEPPSRDRGRETERGRPFDDRRGPRDRGDRHERGDRNDRGDRGPRDRADRPPRKFDAPMVLFRVNVGENQNAEPRWLVPLICRRGGIEGRDIGKIRIGPKSTLFEVNESAAPSFERHATVADPKDPRVLFERADSPRSARLKEGLAEGTAESGEGTRADGEGFERPRRVFDTPRPSREDGPRRDDRPSREDAAPRRDDGPRRDEATRRDDRPRRDFDKPRGGFDRPRRDAAEKPRGGFDRPRRDDMTRPPRNDDRPRRPQDTAPRRDDMSRPPRRDAPPPASPVRPTVSSARPRPVDRRPREASEDLDGWKAPRGKPRPQTPAGYDED